jgi:Tol biopolymer transport system component
MNADGSDPFRLTNNAAADLWPDISPNGKRIVFASDRAGGRDIFVMKSDGAGVTNITNTPASMDDWPRWSPDGKRIVFHSNRDGNFEIYVMNADGTGLTRVTTHSGVDQWPDWSPSGKQLAFRRDHDIYTIELESTDLASRLTTDPAIDQMAAWSPNGLQLAFMSMRDGYCAVYLMDADGGFPVNLTPKDASDSNAAWCSRAPAWSNDGQRIYFSSRRPSTGTGAAEIFVMRRDGTELTRVTNATGEDAGARTR